MKNVYSNDDLTRVGYYQSVLDEAGIANFIRNESTYNLTAPSVVIPHLCVADDADYERAIGLLENLEYSPPVTGEDWKCEACGESVPDNFQRCWNCDAPRPTAEV